MLSTFSGASKLNCGFPNIETLNDINLIFWKGHGKVHIVNINGVTKKDDLKANEILSELDDHEREELVRRLFNPTDNYLRDMHPTAFVKHALDVSTLKILFAWRFKLTWPFF